MAPPPRETRVGLDTFCLTLTRPRSHRANIQHIPSEILCCGFKPKPKTSTYDRRCGLGGQDKTLPELMWARQEILARHTNQGQGNSNASACAARSTYRGRVIYCQRILSIAVIVATFATNLVVAWKSEQNRVPPQGVVHRLVVFKGSPAPS
jgi:hypothetical protein